MHTGLTPLSLQDYLTLKSIGHTKIGALGSIKGYTTFAHGNGAGISDIGKVTAIELVHLAAVQVGDGFLV
jgi:hypothetical protein